MGGGDLRPIIHGDASIPTTSFVARQVNASTFLIIEDDAYGEQPYIYVKIYPDSILVTDTGCNTPRQKNRSITSLRKYIEDLPLAIHHDQPLNPNGAKKYVTICSHCHYDHILGIPQFLSENPTIIASSSDKTFLLHDFPTRSLCKDLNIPTPQYEVSHWARNLEYLSIDHIPFRIQFLHIPGHTPDSLAWYDLDEHHLYIGDTFYERKGSVPIPELPGTGEEAQEIPGSAGAIIFPNEGGNWIQYMSSLRLLLSVVRFRNQELSQRNLQSQTKHSRVKVACGHNTFNADAEEMILEVQTLFERIISGELPAKSSAVIRGAVNDFWIDGDEARYSVLAPRRLVEEVRSYRRIESGEL